MKSLLRTLFLTLAFLALVAPSPARAQQWQWDNVDRVVVFGDLHGDYDKFVDMLRTAGLVDASNAWTGGRTHLVQLGDVPDRGPNSRAILDLLHRLEAPARRAGGAVHALIGNHEAMNVEGDLRYVSAGEYASFADSGSARRRDDYYRRTVEYLRAHPPSTGLPVFDDAFRAQFDAEHPLGWVEHRLAWSPEGEYGRYVSGHDAIIRINDTLFMHGGIGPSYANVDPEVMNDAVRGALRGRPSPTYPSILTDEEGPLWYRGLAVNPEDSERANVAALLARHHVARIVIGHSKVAPTIFPRFEARVIATDVAVRRDQNDPHAFLVIERGGLTTVHRGQPVPLRGSNAAERCAYLTQIASIDATDTPTASFAAVQCAGGQSPESVEPAG